MMIKLSGLNDNIFEINSNMIMYYTPSNIRQIREGEDDVIQEATQITVVGNEKIYVKETPEYIRMLLNNSDKKLFNVLFTTSNVGNSFMYFYDFIPDVYAYNRNEAFKEVKKSLILDNDLRDRVFKATDKVYIILRNETDKFKYSLRKNELEDYLYDKK